LNPLESILNSFLLHLEVASAIIFTNTIESTHAILAKLD